MLKKSLVAILLSVGLTAAYADAPVMVNVTGSMSNQPFNVDKTKWAYQFTNMTGRGSALVFTATVAANSPGAINVQCWYEAGQVVNYTVHPGETSKPCITDDVIRLVVDSAQYKPAMGTYNIVASGSKK